jgi:hypothetical protein
MTPVAKFLRNVGEKLFGRFYDGPDAPEWILHLVDKFTQHYPKATRGEWALFSARIAAESYKAGYVRGFERSERDPEGMTSPAVPPELLADLSDPDWRGRPVFGEELENPADYIPEEIPAAELDPERPDRNPGSGESIVAYLKRQAELEAVQVAEPRHKKGDGNPPSRSG